jgi:hypothetical protein
VLAYPVQLSGERGVEDQPAEMGQVIADLVTALGAGFSADMLAIPGGVDTRGNGAAEPMRSELGRFLTQRTALSSVLSSNDSPKNIS